AAMRRACERELLMAEPIVLGGARFDQRQSLQCLDGRARIDRAHHVAARQHRTAFGIDHGDGTAMRAFDAAAAQDFDEHRIGHGSLGYCMGPTLTATLAPEFNRFTSPPMQPRVKTIRMILLVLFLLPIAARAILF